jgi:hypothetical protein
MKKINPGCYSFCGCVSIVFFLLVSGSNSQWVVGKDIFFIELYYVRRNGGRQVIADTMTKVVAVFGLRMRMRMEE